MGHSVCGDYTWCSARHMQDLITLCYVNKRALTGDENEKFTQIVRVANCLLYIVLQH
jgi:hypothetical protein